LWRRESVWLFRKPRSCDGRGATLIEVMVASTISLLLMTILIVAFVFMGNALTRHNRRSQAQRNVLLAATFARDLCRTANRDTLFAGPTWFSMASWALPNGSLSFSANAEVLWVNWQILYYDATSREMKLQNNPINPPTAYVSPLQLTTFVPSLTDRLMASHITQMTCALVSPPGITLTVVSQVADARAEMITELVPCSSQTDPDAVPTPQP
jgi:hypothetical protein